MSYMNEDSGRKSMAVNLNAEANEKLLSILSKCGLDTKTALVSRVLAWLDGQDDAVIGVIVGTLPKSYAPDIAEMALKKFLETNQQGADVDHGQKMKQAVKKKFAQPKPQESDERDNPPEGRIAAS